MPARAQRAAAADHRGIDRASASPAIISHRGAAFGDGTWPARPPLPTRQVPTTGKFSSYDG
eukprot:SAG31_NODE_35776_length_320_cov_0.651584_1_plen_60_part_10